MNYPRRIRMMLTALAAATGAVMLINFLINPYCAWRHRLVSGIYYRVRFGSERVITPYLLRTAQPTTVLLGTSRVLQGMNIEQGAKDGFLNASLSAATLPEISQEVDIALRNPYLKRIIWGVDFFPFSDLSRADPNTSSRLEGSIRLMVFDTLLSAGALDASYHLISRARSGPGELKERALQPIPWPEPFICHRLDSETSRGLAIKDTAQVAQQVRWEVPKYVGFGISGDAMQRFGATVDKIRHAGVELMVFVPPITEYELELIRQLGHWQQFQQWKRELARATSYTDYSGYNELARTDRMFMDMMHMQPEVGAVILRGLLKEPAPECGGRVRIILDSALRVDANNVEQMLALQEQRKRAAAAEPNRYFQTVAEVLVQGRWDTDRALSASK